MNLEFNIISGYLAGLSVAVTCLGFCIPVFLPLLLSQKRNLKASFLLVLEFSFGRLIGYLLFGLIFGWIGVAIQSGLIHTLVVLGNLWMGILLVVYALGKIDTQYCAYLPFKKIKWPFLIGLTTGVNICPPFLASLTYVFNLKDIIASILYFLMFFLGTSTYIIPIAFLGPITKIYFLKKLAQISGVIVGVYFIIQSLILVLK